MRILGIDPGLSGAWALVDGGVVDRCGDMPVSGEGTRRRISGRVLASTIRSLEPHLAVIEWVQARPGQAAGAMFRFGMSFGSQISICELCEVPFELVVPQVWKRHFNLIGQEKEAGRQKALDLCPGITAMLDRKRDTGRAEAALIGLYGWHRWGPRKEEAV